MYKLLDRNTAQIGDIKFPLAEGNRYYNEYKKWLSEGNHPTADSDSLVIVNSYEAVPEMWVKEGQEPQLTQPMIPERWSDGITTVYTEEEIPTELDAEENTIPDPDFVYFKATEDDSWDYVPAIQAYFEVVDNEALISSIEAEKSLRNIISEARAFGDKMINKFIAGNLILGITQAGMTSQVRKATSEVTMALLTGSLYDAIAEIRNIPVESRDEVFLSESRLLAFINDIETYLGSELSEEL